MFLFLGDKAVICLCGGGDGGGVGIACRGGLPKCPSVGDVFRADSMRIESLSCPLRAYRISGVYVLSKR